MLVIYLNIFKCICFIVAIGPNPNNSQTLHFKSTHVFRSRDTWIRTREFSLDKIIIATKRQMFSTHMKWALEIGDSFKPPQYLCCHGRCSVFQLYGLVSITERSSNPVGTDRCGCVCVFVCLASLCCYFPVQSAYRKGPSHERKDILFQQRRQNLVGSLSFSLSSSITQSSCDLRSSHNIWSGILISRKKLWPFFKFLMTRILYVVNPYNLRINNMTFSSFFHWRRI